jgi:glycine/D-amino acid oxidase-like deaminating enzyme
MKDEPGFICRLRSDRVPISRAMHSPHVELRPDAPGQLLLHSREIDALIGAGPSDADLTDRLKQLAVKVVPSLEAANVVATKIAWRPIPIDGFPSVGPVPGVDGYFEAITHSGITLGPIVGRLLASEILDQTVDDLLEPYRPSRFH